MWRPIQDLDAMVVCELIFSNYAFIIYNKKIPDLDYDAVDGNTVLSEFL